jgi:hypothetical protein
MIIKNQIENENHKKTDDAEAKKDRKANHSEAETNTHDYEKADDGIIEAETDTQNPRQNDGNKRHNRIRQSSESR